MRIWGRVFANPPTNPPTWTWVAVETTPDGFDDYVFVTNLIQVLKLILGESPFYGDWGIPQQQSIIQQVFPDYYVNLTQTRFASRFASLIITKIPATYPYYAVNVVTQQGVKMALQVPV